jgi:hypothetical protein
MACTTRSWRSSGCRGRSATSAATPTASPYSAIAPADTAFARWLWPRQCVHVSTRVRVQLCVQPCSPCSPCSRAAVQPCSRAAVQPCSRAALQPCSRAAVQPCVRVSVCVRVCVRACWFFALFVGGVRWRLSRRRRHHHHRRRRRRRRCCRRRRPRVCSSDPSSTPGRALAAGAP